MEILVMIDGVKVFDEDMPCNTPANLAKSIQDTCNQINADADSLVFLLEQKGKIIPQELREGISDTAFQKVENSIIQAWLWGNKKLCSLFSPKMLEMLDVALVVSGQSPDTTDGREIMKDAMTDKDSDVCVYVLLATNQKNIHMESHMNYSPRLSNFLAAPRCEWREYKKKYNLDGTPKETPEC